VVLAVNATIKPWLETGEPILDGSPMTSLTKALQRIAAGYAAARNDGIRASLAVVQAKQHEWHALHEDAAICVADGSVEPGARDVIAAAGNVLYDACERIAALTSATLAP